MSGAEASGLALFWAGVLAAALLAYAVLDGFDLGVGILSGTTRDAARRDRMYAAIAPFWDGNETWLVVGGATLYAAFPAAYAVLLEALSVPVALMLVGLVFRGVAFEFRRHAARSRAFWDAGFCAGSLAVAFAQGAAVGALVDGVPIANGHYAGGAFLWLAPFPLLTGAGLVLGYALLGAGWLVLKTTGDAREWARRRVPWLAAATFAALALAFAGALDESALVRSRALERAWSLAFPVLAVAALAGAALAARGGRRDGLPFALGAVAFACAFAGLGAALWPLLVPYELAIAEAAAPEASLRFLFAGAGVVVLPVVAVYTGGVYWLFRGKVG